MSPRIAPLVIVVLSAAPACGSEEMFERRLADGQRSIDSVTAARVLSDDQGLQDALVVGDLDGDGLDDAIVTAAYVLDDSGPLVTHWTVVYGGATGDIDAATLPSLTTPLPDDQLRGTAVPAGDIDGDGLDDVLFLHNHNDTGCPGPGGSGPAGVFVLYGSTTRLSGATPLASAAPFLSTGDPCTRYPAARGLGDLDGDGLDEFAISGGVSESAPYTAPLFVFYGRSQRLSGSIDLEAVADAVISAPATPVVDLAYVQPAGDVDGDGYDDFFTTSRTPDWQVYYVGLVRGGATRLTGTHALDDVAATKFFGDRLCPRGAGVSLGDIDDDGAPDIAIESCPAEAGLADQAFASHVFYGRPGGFPATLDVSAADAALTGTSTMARFTVGPLASGDLDGDGLPELVLGDAGLDGRNGGVYIVAGQVGRLSGEIGIANVATAYMGQSVRALCAPNTERSCVFQQLLGSRISLGDLTGDGRADVLVSAPSNDGAIAKLGHHGDSAAAVYVLSTP